HVARHDEGVVAADGAVEALAVVADPRLDLAVVEAGHEVQTQLDAAADTFDHAQQLTSGMGGATASHAEAVVELALAVIGAEGRLEHEGAVDVGPERLLAQCGGRDRAVAAVLPVEDAAEAAAGVEARRARPVDRSHARHEGDRM